MRKTASRKLHTFAINTLTANIPPINLPTKPKEPINVKSVMIFLIKGKFWKLYFTWSESFLKSPFKWSKKWTLIWWFNTLSIMYRFPSPVAERSMIFLIKSLMINFPFTRKNAVNMAIIFSLTNRNVSVKDPMINILLSSKVKRRVSIIIKSKGVTQNHSDLFFIIFLITYFFRSESFIVW